MPRPRSFTQQPAEVASFAMKMPQEHLARVSAASARPLSAYVPEPRADAEWQAEAYLFNEIIGEVGYLHNHIANLVASCDFRIVEVGLTNEGPITNESNDPRAMRVMAAFTGEVGGATELKRRGAMHYQIAGESVLLGTPLRGKWGENLGFTWEFLSTQELKVEGQGPSKKVVRNARGGRATDAEQLDIDSFVARFWRPDPKFSKRADSPMKRVLPICRELITLSEVVEAIARTRLAAGILFVPEEMSFGPIDENESSEDSDDIDPLTEAVAEHMSAPVEDRTSSASLVPLVMRGPAEFADAIKLISLGSDIDKMYQDLRQELTLRIARGLDAPPEVIQGKAQLNHWSAYAVDADLVSKHVNPVGDALAEFLTTAYLRPMLIEYEDVEPSDALRFKLSFDSRKITSRADEGPAATGAYDRMELSDLAYLRANGFDEEDAPDPEERKRRMLEKVMLADPSYAPSIMPLLYPELEGLIVPSGATGGGVTLPVAGGPAPRDGGAEPTPAPSAQVASLPSEEMPLDALIDRLTTAADAALERALERGANRVLSRVNGKTPVMREAFKNLPKIAVMANVSDGDCSLLGISRAELFADAWVGFTERGEAWVRAWLLSTGVPAFEADTASSRVMELVTISLSGWLSSTSKQVPMVGPNGLRIPSEIVSVPLLEGLTMSVPPSSLPRVSV